MSTQRTKIASPRAELSVLRALCHKNKAISGTLLSLVDDSYFYRPESQEIFEAIKRHMNDSGTPPAYRLLIEDPDLSDDTRSYFRDSVASVNTVSDAQKAARILNKYRQTRGMFNMAAHINNALNGGKFSLEELIADTSTAFNVVQSKKSNRDSFLHFGRNNNSRDMVHSILYEDNSEDVIPTGIKTFDDVSGGWSRGSLVTIGANSGGGKSLTANDIAIKMATRGYKVLVVPLEMSKKEMTERTMANVTKFPHDKIHLQKLATGEKELVYKRQRRWERKVKEAGGRYTVFKPQEDMTIEEIMAAISAYQVDVVFIDYISLLKGVDGDDMWRALGAVARYAKINAEVENRVNVLLCQVDDAGKIRYARAISEHSSNSWIWVATKESKETGITRIEQPKSRNSLSFPFSVKINYAYMRLEDLPNDEAFGSGDPSDLKSGRREKKGEDKDAKPERRKKNIPNLAESDI
jgi:replicative DNA helicase